MLANGVLVTLIQILYLLGKLSVFLKSKICKKKNGNANSTTQVEPYSNNTGRELQ
jgi:hypothetical protein